MQIFKGMATTEEPMETPLEDDNSRLSAVSAVDPPPAVEEDSQSQMDSSSQGGVGVEESTATPKPKAVRPVQVRSESVCFFLFVEQAFRH